MNRTTIRNAALSMALAVLLLLTMSTLMGATNPIGPGVTGQKYTGVSPMTFASTRYTSTQTASTAGVDVGLFGSVEIQTLATITNTATITITPQFSNQPVPCSGSVTSWVNAFEDRIVPTSNITTTVVVLTTTGTLTSTTIATTGTLARETLSLVTSGSIVTGANTIELREMPTQGRCFRVTVQSTALVFTPTVYLRLVNRQ